MEGLQSQKNNNEELKNKRRKELLNHILNTYVKPEEYYKNGEKALSISSQMMGNGVFLKGELIGYNPNDKAPVILDSLSDEVKKNVNAHGVACHITNDYQSQRKQFPLFVLLQIMTTGEIKGDWGTLKVADGSPYGHVFMEAPFILLSNKNEPLAEIDKNGVAKLKNLRTVLVNGKYESMVDDFKKRFPGVSFRTAEQINDDIFYKKSPPFKSFNDVIEEKIDEEFGNIKNYY